MVNMNDLRKYVLLKKSSLGDLSMKVRVRPLTFSEHDVVR